MKFISKSLFLNLFLSLGVFVYFAPLGAMEEHQESKTAPELSCLVTEAEYAWVLEISRQRRQAKIFDETVRNADFRAACKLINAGNMADWKVYTAVVMKHLEGGKELFDHSRMQVKLIELLLDKCLSADNSYSVNDYIDDYVNHDENRISLLELALARVLERRRHGIDSSDYERLVKKLISLRVVVLVDAPKIRGFSPANQLQALSLVDPLYRNSIQVAEGYEEHPVCDEGIFCSETRLIKQFEQRPVGLQWLEAQCPPQEGDLWSLEDAYNSLLHSYLAPEPLPGDVARLIEQYHDHVPDAGSCPSVTYGADQRDEYDGGEPSLVAAPRKSMCERCVIQ